MPNIFEKVILLPNVEKNRVGREIESSYDISLYTVVFYCSLSENTKNGT